MSGTYSYFRSVLEELVPSQRQREALWDAICGHITRRVFVLHGHGNNGKSLLMGIIWKAFPDECGYVGFEDEGGDGYTSRDDADDIQHLHLVINGGNRYINCCQDKVSLVHSDMKSIVGVDDIMISDNGNLFLMTNHPTCDMGPAGRTYYIEFPRTFYGGLLSVDVDRAAADLVTQRTLRPL